MLTTLPGATRVQARHRDPLTLKMVWPKTVMEWWLALALTILLLPIIVLLAVLIRLDSPGPAFYRQTRIGLRGAEFTILKLRTMYADAGPLVAKTPDDDRITRLGRFLRCSSLDELPQLFNVLRGDMALVGPRPHCRYEVDRYTSPATWARLNMRPGITGLWQVSGRSNLPPAEQIRLDIEYVARWSLALDLWIVVRTLPAVFRAEGAY